MEEKINHLESLIVRLEAWAMSRVEVMKLKIVHKTALVASTIISNAALILILSLVIIIASIGLSLWVGGLLGEYYYGFFCVGGFYGVAGSVLYFLLRGRIKKKISNSIISQLLN